MPPNVLLVITDQQSRFAQSAAGNEWVRTPHLDSLSAAGVRFTRAYCAAPVCSPSRASLATGRPPHQTGLVANGMSRTAALPELCGHFLGHGYDVGWVGIRPGNPPESTGGPRFELLLPDGIGTRLGRESDTAIADAAIRYLRRPGRQRPFFLGVTLVNPHDICYWVMGRAPDTACGGPLPPLPAGFDPAPDEPDFIRRCRQRTHYGPENTFTRDWDRGDWRRYLREYHALTERADAETGRILQALGDAGLEEDTLVAFSSDHGEGMARHRWVVKLMLWESVISVPLTLSWPGVIPRGRVRNQLASGLDLLPTLCDYAGLPVPAGVVGHSLRGAVEGDVPGRQYVVTELHPDDQDLAFAARIVVSQHHKYAAFSEGRPRELLFDLEADPGETRNLAADPSHAPALAAHRRYLREWVERTMDLDFRLPPRGRDGLSDREEHLLLDLVGLGVPPRSIDETEHRMPDPPAAILFDLDDTILEFESVAAPAWQHVTERFAGEFGGVPPERVRRSIAAVSRAWWSDPERHRQGRLDVANTRRANVAEALRALGIGDDGAPRSLSRRLAAAFTEARTEAIRPFAGAVETLRHFASAGVPMALVTNGDAAGQRAKIERFGLAGFFRCIVIEEEFGAGKPDERVFRHALTALGADPPQAWMVGDNLRWEIEPCRRLGLHTVWVDVRGQGLPADSPVSPHRTVRAIAELAR